MSKIKTVFVITVSILMFGTIYSSCKKKTTLDTDYSAGSDNVALEQAFLDVFLTVYKNSDSAYVHNSTCPAASYSVSTSSYYNWTNYMRFSSSCKNRVGTIQADLTSSIHDSLAEASITYSAYTYGSYNVSVGNHTIKNKGRNSSGNYIYEVQITDASLGSIKWSTSTSTIEHIKGGSTATLSDDIFLVKGTRSGTSSNGEAFTSEIVTPLRIHTGCKYVIQSGVLYVTPKDKKDRVVNFGDANNPTCDDSGNIRIEDKYYNFTLLELL